MAVRSVSMTDLAFLAQEANDRTAGLWPGNEAQEPRFYSRMQQRKGAQDMLRVRVEWSEGSGMTGRATVSTNLSCSRASQACSRQIGGYKTR